MLCQWYRHTTKDHQQRNGYDQLNQGESQSCIGALHYLVSSWGKDLTVSTTPTTHVKGLCLADRVSDRNCARPVPNLGGQEVNAHRAAAAWSETRPTIVCLVIVTGDQIPSEGYGSCIRIIRIVEDRDLHGWIGRVDQSNLLKAEIQACTWSHPEGT